MPSYVVPPTTKRLTLPCGEWIDVKARLNHGEYQDMMERCYRLSDDGVLQRVPFKYNEAVMSAYVVDWSLTGLDEQVIPIRGTTPDEILSAARKLEQWVVREIRDAIDAHITEITRAQAEKNDLQWRRRVLNDLRVARRMHWRYEWVRELDQAVHDVLMDELLAEEPK